MRFCSTCKRTWEDDFRICPIDGVPLQEMPTGSDPLAGKSLGSFRLQEKIADGDLGPVYKAMHPAHGLVAVQVIAPDTLGSPILLEAFGDAVKLASKLNHPNVVRVFGMETTPDGSTAVLMECVQGRTLQQHRLDNPGMTAAEAVRIAGQAAAGIQAAHRQSMLHSALHPSRILLSPDGNAKVAGFHRSGVRSGTDAFSATPESLPYLAPEQIGAIRDMVGPDYRTDVYSLGVILYEMLAARLPYEAASAEEMVAVMEGAPPLPPNFSNPQVAPLLARMVMRALSKDPTERHGTVDEFIREMEACGRQSKAPQAPPPACDDPFAPAAAHEGGLFAARPQQESSDLFAPPPETGRRQDGPGLWHEEASEKPDSGEGSVFSWFKTRIGGSQQKSPARGGRKGAPEDSFFGRPAAPHRKDDYSDEHTVVVSGGGRSRGRRRSFSDTFAGFRSRDADLTGTLPRRRLSSKVYLAMGLGGVFVIGVILTLLFYSMSSPTGKLRVDSAPPGAQVYINDEFRGHTPLPYTDLQPGSYRLRLQADGYEAKVDSVDVSRNGDVQRFYSLVRQAPLLPPPLQPEIHESPPYAPTTPGSPLRAAPFENMFNSALRARSFYPPAPDNAWDILQRWQLAEAADASLAQNQARQNFCRDLEGMGREKLEQRDFTGVRAILDLARTRSPAPGCITGLQAAYEKSISNSLSVLRGNVRAAMDRQNYVTPDTDNALRYVRLMLAIDPQEPEAKALEPEIFSRAWDQADVRSAAKQHQEALEIYTQLRQNYERPPVGPAALNEKIERENGKMTLYKALKAPISLAVKHGHGRKYVLFGRSECTGILRIDGFGIEYQSTGEHSFKIALASLTGVQADKNKLTLLGAGIPEGKIELEKQEGSGTVSVAEAVAKIQEYQRLYAEYVK